MKRAKKNFYFTFGENHVSLNNVYMRYYWVKVSAYSYEEARTCFVEQFAIPVMGDAYSWSSQYEEKSFDSSYYIYGQYDYIDA